MKTHTLEAGQRPTQRPQVRIPLKPRKTFFFGLLCNCSNCVSAAMVTCSFHKATFTQDRSWTGLGPLLFIGAILEPVQVFTQDLSGTVLEGIQQVQFWIHSKLVPEQSRVSRRPIWSNFQTKSIWIRLESVQCQHSLSWQGQCLQLQQEVCKFEFQLDGRPTRVLKWLVRSQVFQARKISVKSREKTKEL